MASGGDENRNLRSASDASLDNVAVNDVFVEDCLRDACHLGDLQTLQGIVRSLSEDELQTVFNKASPCTGTPLFEAVIAHRQEVVCYILSLNVCDLEMECFVNVCYPIIFKDKCTVLALACACGTVAVVRELLDHGADVNHPSEHSSPMIYASEYNNVELLSLLLRYGADMGVVPQSMQIRTTLLPLYQACMLGHQETALLLLDSVAVETDKRIALLGLLGAQVINLHTDFLSGVEFWRQALQLLEEVNGAEKLTGGETLDLVTKLERLGMGDMTELPPGASGEATAVTPPGGVLSSIKMCSSITELQDIENDHIALRFQALLVLEKILGPSHPQMSEQVSSAARYALESGDLAMACTLFVYVVESNLSCQQFTTAIENASQMADLLLKVYLDGAEMLNTVDNLADLLLSVLSLTQQAASLTYQGLDGLAQPRSRHSFSRVKLLSEMTETFLAFLKLAQSLVLTEQQASTLHTVVRKFLQLGRHPAASKYNVESELFKLVVHGGKCAYSTLYFMQDEILPDTGILHLLLQCGGSVNCQDTVCGDTPLHFSLDCPHPRPDIVHLLLDYQAHLDIHNRYGQTPLSLLAQHPQLGVNMMHYITLKCLAARAIMAHSVPYRGHIPKLLEEFIPWHGLPHSVFK